MRVKIGGAGGIEVDASDRCELSLLGQEAASRLGRDSAMDIPWDIALLLLELYEEDDAERIAALEARRPTWMTHDDEDVLVRVLLEAALPQRTPLKLKVRATGVAGRPGFAISSEWLAAGGRAPREGVAARGALVVHGAAPPRRMSLGQYLVTKLLAHPPALGVARDDDWRWVARVKAAVPREDPGVVFDAFLEKQHVASVEKVRPRLVAVDGGYQIRPSAAGVKDGALDEYFYESAAGQLGKTPLSIGTSDGEKTRVVFSEAAGAGMAKCRGLDVLSPNQAAHALSHPEDVFGSDLDLSELSERVTGLGPPVRKVSPILKELPSNEWWNWNLDASLEDLTEQEAPPAPALDLTQPATRAALRAAIESADAAGDTFIPHPGGDGFISVDNQLRETVAAAETLAAASAEGEGQERRPQPLREVLQVSENLESLLFDRATLPKREPPPAQPRPPGLRSPFDLKPHQVSGYSWLCHLYGDEAGRSAWRGALLADDMGLGKTVQVLSFLSWLKSHRRPGPHLVVGPVAILQNWQEEASRFFGAVHEPLIQVRGKDLPDELEAAAARLAAHQLVLVSYETLRQRELVFARVPWNVVVLDEAQKAKEPAAQISRVVRTLKARFRLAMTGTPVENTLKELWNIYDWAVPGLLGSLRDFAREFIKPVADASHQERQRLADRLNQLVEPVFTRRMKEHELKADLPEIQRHHHRVSMSIAQLARYEQLMAIRDGSPGQALGVLQHLLAACAHPSMGEEGALPPYAEQSFPKADKLFSLLDAARARGEKALVFVRWRKLQRWLADEIEHRYGVMTPIINGESSDSKARMSVIREFSNRDGFAALVLAPRAAGVGLNIVAANHVIHYTREWNPAIENQATDRAYRIGQTRPVHVHTLTAVSPHGRTVEQTLADLLDNKRQLMTDFVVPIGGSEISLKEVLDG